MLWRDSYLGRLLPVTAIPLIKGEKDHEKTIQVDLVCYFTAEDSGTESCPIMYCAYGDGEVILNAGISINTEDFTAVTDVTMLSRLQESARDKVLCVDLSKYGITAEDLGKRYSYRKDRQRIRENLMKKITAVVVGYGGRGAAYAKYATENPEALQIVAVETPALWRR